MSLFFEFRKMVQQYLDYAKAILTSPESNFKGGSKGSGIISLFGYQNRYDLSKGFPLVTTKQMPAKSKSMFTELLWFLKGETSIEYMEKNKSPVWRSDAFQYNLEKMSKAGIYPKGMEKYSPEWTEALNDYGEKIRTNHDFAKQFGDAGPIYPKQWRRWSKFSPVEGGDKQLYVENEKGVFIPIEGKAYQEKEIDQVRNMIEGLKKKPTGKKHILTGWNVADVPDMSLPPCHLLFQATANENGELEMQLYQRSCDSFLGVPFNIAQYAALTQIIAKEAGMTPKTFVHTFGDAHFYTSIGERTKWHKENFEELQARVRIAKDFEEKTGDKSDYLEVRDWINKNAPADGNMEKYDHVTGILEQLANESLGLCKLEIADKPFDELELEDFEIKDYKHHQPIRRRMCV
jgi:thymidylate synthase